jgi:hypothetical protein
MPRVCIPRSHSEHFNGVQVRLILTDAENRGFENDSKDDSKMMAGCLRRFLNGKKRRRAAPRRETNTKPNNHSFDF